MSSALFADGHTLCGIQDLEENTLFTETVAFVQITNFFAFFALITSIHSHKDLHFL